MRTLCRFGEEYLFTHVARPWIRWAGLQRTREVVTPRNSYAFLLRDREQSWTPDTILES